jgi:hypothetical protein
LFHQTLRAVTRWHKHVTVAALQEEPAAALKEKTAAVRRVAAAWKEQQQIRSREREGGAAPLTSRGEVTLLQPARKDQQQGSHTLTPASNKSPKEAAPHTARDRMT